MTHICVGNLTIIGSDNGLSPGRRQAIIWTNAAILLIGHLGTNFNEISIEIYTFLFKKMYFKMSSAKCRPFCLGLNVLMGVISYLCKKTMSISNVDIIFCALCSITFHDWLRWHDCQGWWRQKKINSFISFLCLQSGRYCLRQAKLNYISGWLQSINDISL